MRTSSGTPRPGRDLVAHGPATAREGEHDNIRRSRKAMQLPRESCACVTAIVEDTHYSDRVHERIHGSRRQRVGSESRTVQKQRGRARERSPRMIWLARLRDALRPLDTHGRRPRRTHSHNRRLARERSESGSCRCMGGSTGDLPRTRLSPRRPPCLPDGSRSRRDRDPADSRTSCRLRDRSDTIGRKPDTLRATAERRHRVPHRARAPALRWVGGSFVDTRRGARTLSHDAASPSRAARPQRTMIIEARYALAACRLSRRCA